MLTKNRGFGQVVPEASPQSSNTGVSPLETLIDWCQGTFPHSNLESVCSLVASFLLCEWVDRSHGIRFYEHSRSCGGALVAWSPRLGGKVTGRTDAYMQLPGAVLACLPAWVQLQMFQQLKELGFRCSRLDLVLDDYSKRFRPADAARVYDAKGVTGFRKGGYYTSKKSPNHEAEQTAYFGSRGKTGSGKFLRIYDKWLESGGERDCVRIELSFYGHYSRQVFDELASVPDVELWCEAIPGYIFGAINFLQVEEGKEARADKCPRVAWWESIVGDRVGIKLAGKKIEKTIEKAKRWWSKQVAPSFAMIMESFGIQGKSNDEFWEWFWESVFDGEKRWNEKHLEILERTKQVMKLEIQT